MNGVSSKPGRFRQADKTDGGSTWQGGTTDSANGRRCSSGLEPVFVGLTVIGGVFGEEPEPDVAPAQAVTTPLTQTPEPASSPTTAPLLHPPPTPTEEPTPTPTSEPPNHPRAGEDCLDPWDGNPPMDSRIRSARCSTTAVDGDARDALRHRGLPRSTGS